MSGNKNSGNPGFVAKYMYLARFVYSRYGIEDDEEFFRFLGVQKNVVSGWNRTGIKKCYKSVVDLMEEVIIMRNPCYRELIDDFKKDLDRQFKED